MTKTECNKILLLAIDDDQMSLDVVCATLEQDGLEILTTTDPKVGIELIASRRPEIVITDLMMPGITGMDVLAEASRIDPTIDVVLLTAHYSTEAAVEAIQNGASDYLNKPVDTRRLASRVNQLLAQAQRHRSAQRLDSELLEAHRFRGIIGRAPLMLDVFSRIERVAPHYRTVLVTGPTGTGKELIARAIHDASPVSQGPFVVCNTAAIPDNLVESELFGHVRGAFTGAAKDKIGLFEAANCGTILLDEIGEMPLPAQAKLLRVVQHQELQRVGDSGIRKLNVRIITATHRDLRAMVDAREFREDLYFRLGMVELKIPALRDRKEDLPLLLRHFLMHYSNMYGKELEGFTRKAEIALAAYDWPGNVRELEGVVGSAAMLTDSRYIDISDLPPHLLAPPVALGGGAGAELRLSLEEIQVLHARRVASNLAGDKARAAEILGVSRATLYRLLAKEVPNPSR